MDYRRKQKFGNSTHSVAYMWSMDHAEYILVSLAGILILGISVQWLAWSVKLPAVLLLLCTGFLAGPVTGIIDPQSLFDDLLLPVVSLSVGLIFFEGGLNLRLR